jgi:hypothetical protein
MPPASDYASMPEGVGTVDSKEERNAELILARLADARLVMSGRPAVKIVTIVFLASQVVTGLWLRTLVVPRGWEVAAACAFLMIAALALPAAFRRGRKAEPQWARAAAVHERSLSGRVPEEMLGMVREFMASMTTGTRWRGDAHLYVSRYTEEEPVHYAACCAGRMFVMGGRLLVILGEHLAAGPASIAEAVLAHERRHVGGWRLYAYSVGAVAGAWGLIVVGWAVPPWPNLLLIAAAVRVVTTAMFWAIEVSCDVGSARDTSPAAILASVDYKQRTEGGARAMWPRGKRWAVSILTWAAGAEHPPYSVRRAAIRTLARRGGAAGRER